MNNYCIDLSLDINPLADGVSFASLPAKPFVPLGEDKLNPVLVKMYKDLGLVTEELAIIFSLPSNRTNSIHNDVEIENGDIAKINWSYSPNHTMNWYRTLENRTREPVLMVDHGSCEPGCATCGRSGKYFRYYSEQVEIIHSQVVGKPSLIQAGIPHNVENFNGIRRCVSLAMMRESNGTVTPVTFAEAKEMLAKYLVG